MGRRSTDALAIALATLLLVVAWTGVARAQAPVAADFQKVTLDDNTQNPMELDVAPDGRVFYIERDGRLMIWKPNTQQTVTAGTVPGHDAARRTACSACSSRPTSRSATGSTSSTRSCRTARTRRSSRASRSTATRSTWRSEQRILTFSTSAASAATRPARCTSAPTAACTSRRATTRTRSTRAATTRSTSAPAAPPGTRSARAANTNDLNGKILRIKPMEIPLGTPGLGDDLHDPAPATCSPRARRQDAPGDLRHGLPQPVPLHGRPGDGLGADGADYGPDASTTNANRGPQGSVEYNVLPSAGNYGWPYCIRDNTPYNDYDFATSTSGAKFDCANPVNDSPNNTGLTNLPPARGATAWMGFSDTDPRFTPEPRHRRRPDGRPALPLRPDARLRRASSRRSTTTSGSSPSGTTAGSRPPTSTPTGAMTGVQTLRARHRLQAPDGPRLRSRRRAVRDRVGLGLQRRQRRLGRLPGRLPRGRQGPGRARPPRTPTERPRAAGGQLLQRRLAATPRAARSPTRGTSTPTARRLDGRQPVAHLHRQRRLPAKLTVTDAGGLTGVANILDHGRQPRADGHDRDPRERPDRVVHGQDPVQDLGHRPRGRHDRRGHQLRRRHGQDLARP